MASQAQTLGRAKEYPRTVVALVFAERLASSPAPIGLPNEQVDVVGEEPRGPVAQAGHDTPRMIAPSGCEIVSIGAPALGAWHLDW